MTDERYGVDIEHHSHLCEIYADESKVLMVKFGWRKAIVMVKTK
jgi:hypothetical protein